MPVMFEDVMLAEAVEQLQGDVPTHVFIQAGVGGLAAAVCAYFWELWGAERPRFIVVEPEQANCLQESARSGERATVEGDLDTLMAGLACGEVSQPRRTDRSSRLSAVSSQILCRNAGGFS